MRKKYYRLNRNSLSTLFEALQTEGFSLFGPCRTGPAIEWQPINSLSDLPVGWTHDASPASYHLQPRTDQAHFGFWTGPDGLKKYLHPARATVSRAERLNGNGAFRIIDTPSPAPKRAFIGARACDLAALAIQDRVLLGDRYADDIYRANRQHVFLVAVHCTSSAPTCFCASVNAGPQARAGFDIALHERLDQPAPEYLAEAGSAAGVVLLDRINAPAAPADWPRQLAEATAAAGIAQVRRVDLASAPETIEQSFDHSRWELTGQRCLACGNCTSVCPTCFCVSFEDRTSLDLQTAERSRTWDSCFTQNFTYIHGGSIRLSPKSRYRHWLSHKLARWQQQFGTPGCVGCGRCIVWCPAAIDIAEEFNALLPAASTPAS